VCPVTDLSGSIGHLIELRHWYL